MAMDTNLSSAERRWQRRSLFHSQRTHRGWWAYALLLLVTLAAIGWVATGAHGLDTMVDQLSALYHNVAG